MVNSYAYSPWGEIRTQTESVTNPIKYAGEYYDDELDMLYLRARYYDPQIGRFISLDAERGSIQNPMDMNRYVYCRNNPIKYVDPTGMHLTYDLWNWAEDNIWKSAALAASAIGWQLTADLLWLAASGSGNVYSVSDGSYASELVKNDKGINQFVNDTIWAYGTSKNNSNPLIPTQSYTFPLNNGDLGAALHNVYVDIYASRNTEGTWNARVVIRDIFDFTELKNPFKQGSVIKSLLWAVNDIAYIDTEWGLLDPVKVLISYFRKY